MLASVQDSLIKNLPGLYRREGGTTNHPPAKMQKIQHDSAQLSEGARLLNGQNVNFGQSFHTLNDERFEFNLSFQAEKQESLSAHGYYSRETRSLSVSFNYQFEQTVKTDEGTFLKKYTASFEMNMREVNEKSVTASVQKEDITKFVLRVVQELLDKAGDKDIRLNALYLDKEDLKELLGMSDEEAGKKLLQVLNLAIAVAKLRAMMDNKDEDAEVIDMHPEREKWLNIEAKKIDKEHIDYSFRLEEISSELLPGNTDADDSNLPIAGSREGAGGDSAQDNSMHKDQTTA